MSSKKISGSQRKKLVEHNLRCQIASRPGQQKISELFKKRSAEESLCDNECSDLIPSKKSKISDSATNLYSEESICDELCGDHSENVATTIAGNIQFHQNKFKILDVEQKFSVFLCEPLLC